jgi:hypothetical protein
MTPFELGVCAELFSEQIKSDQENDLFLAYINAYWQRVDPLKSFGDMIGKKREAVKMDDQAMLAKAMQLNAMFGGTTQKDVPILEERG